MSLYLQSISLLQFKNYGRFRLGFDKDIICLTGKNGIGKTNLLDAIYYLCFGKSYFQNQDSLNVQYGSDGFRLEGTFLKDEKTEKITCTLKQGKKDLRLNGISYSRLSRHLGHFPAVMIAPDDAALIREGSEQRRRFLDSLLTQMDLPYLDDLIAYQKVLLQRNSLLKNTPAGKLPDRALLSVLDEQLSYHGENIYNKRKSFFPELKEKTGNIYQDISNTGERTDILYQSSLSEMSFQDLLAQNQPKDFVLQRTSDGIHRDDLLFLLDGHPLKQTASQGQRKNFLFALKLAQYEILRSSKGLSPVLLLDDIFEKLDQERLEHLVHYICRPGFGQVFITDTEEERLRKIFKGKEDRLQVVTLC